jgi:hypothetical protein
MHKIVLFNQINEVLGLYGKVLLTKGTESITILPHTEITTILNAVDNGYTYNDTQHQGIE